MAERSRSLRTGEVFAAAGKKIQMTKARKANSDLIRAKNQFRGTPAKLEALLALRRESVVDLLPDLAAWSSPWMVALHLTAQPIPRLPGQLQAITTGSVYNLERELAWALGLISKHRRHLERHVQMRLRLTELMLAGSVPEVQAHLDEMDRALGLSFTSVSTRIAILQLTMGLEAQKEFVTALRDAGSSKQLGFYSFWWSVRAQDETSEDHFRTSFEYRLAEWSVPEPDQSVVRYLLLDQLPLEGGEAILLSGLSGASIIDLYEAFVSLASAAVAEARGGSVERFTVAVGKVNEWIVDGRLQRILIAGGKPAALPVGADQYRSAWLTGGTAPAVTPRSPEEFLTSLSFATRNEAMANPIASRMAKALRPSAADDVRDTGAGRLALLMAQTPLGHWIGPLANSTGPNSRPFDTKQNVLRFIFSNDGVLEVMGGLAQESRQDFASRLRQSVGGPISIAAELLAGKTEATPLAPAASRRLSLWRATFAGTPEGVLDLATQFLQAERSEEALYLKVSSLLALGRIEEAVDYAVEQLLPNQQLHAYLPMHELVAATYFDGTNRFPERLTTPLLLYYYAQYVSSEAMSYRSYSAEDFLFSLGLERPSELQPTAWPGHAELLRTFLWDVCTLSTIRLFTAFDSERSIEDERVKICQILSTWLPDEREAFDDEALSIVRGRLVKDAILEIQKSKISFDEQGLLNWARRNAKEDYLRYQALISSGLVVVDENFRSAVVEALSTGNVSSKLFEVPKNEASTLFIELVAHLLREIATNAEYGLDCYLSLRIRHGTLSGALRSAPESERIVTRKESDSGSYRSNEHWRGLLGLADRDWQRVDERLAAFSADLDAFIETITARYVQVRRDDKPDGIFRANAAAVSILTLALETPLGTDFDEFFQKVVDLFWQLLEGDLKAARELFDRHIREQQRSIYDAAEEEFRSDFALVPLADAFVRARNQADLSIDMVRDWFELPLPSGHLALSLNELIDIAMEATKRLHPDFNPNLDAPEFDDVPQFQGALNLFSDILFVVFENIWAHSGLSTPNVAVRCEAGDGFLRVRIENAVAPENLERHAQNVEAARVRIQDQSYLQSVSREGGTGFPKLAKLIHYRDSEAELDFGIERSTSIFWLQFRLMTTILEGRDEPNTPR